MPKTFESESGVGTVTSNPLKMNLKPRNVRTYAKPLLR
jgi:hypothetical protein